MIIKFQYVGEDELIMKEKHRFFTARGVGLTKLFFVDKKNFNRVTSDNYIISIFLNRISVKLNWQREKINEITKNLQDDFNK